MLESLIYALIYLAVLVLAVKVFLWFLADVVGMSLPDQIVKIIWFVVALIALLILIQLLLPGGVLPRLR